MNWSGTAMSQSDSECTTFVMAVKHNGTVWYGTEWFVSGHSCAIPVHPSSVQCQVPLQKAYWEDWTELIKRNILIGSLCGSNSQNTNVRLRAFLQGGRVTPVLKCYPHMFLLSYMSCSSRVTLAKERKCDSLSNL